jgi:acid phosphatase type 7
MRWAALAVLVSSAPAWGESYAYVKAGDEHEWTAASAPLPQVEFGRFAARLVGNRPALEIEEMVAPVAEWNKSAAPFGAPKSATVVGDVARERVAAIFLRKTFVVGEERDRIKVLHLRARYQDGLVARINDVEVARRGLEPNAPPGRLAQRTHGPEWESFYIEARPGLLRPGDNLLAIEVRPSAVRLTPSVDVELVGSDVEKIVRGPIVGRVGSDRAVITFETDAPSLGEVRWGREASRYDQRLAGAGPVTHHQFALTGLFPDAEIHYQVAAGGEASADLSFHTMAERPAVVRFVVYGDVRTGHDVHAEIARAVMGEAPDFIITTGDMVLRGTDEADWQRFFAVAGDLVARVPMYPALGNHDLGAAGEGERHFEDVFGLTDRPADCPPGAAWYSFDVGAVHVAMLDSNHYQDDRQLAWLEGDLGAARARGVRAIFAVGHHGPFAWGPHGGEPTAAERYVPVLARHGATVFFSGHDHLYQRGRAGGLTYVVSGGGGAPLYQPRCGGRGQAECRGKDGTEMAVAAYHYVVVEVYRDDARLCAKRPDGTPLEACVTLPLSAGR